MLQTRPDVNAGPIKRSFRPAKVGADIGSAGRRGSSSLGSPFGLAAGSCALLSRGFLAVSWRARSVLPCLASANNAVGMEAAIKLTLMIRVRVIFTGVLLGSTRELAGTACARLAMPTAAATAVSILV